MLAIHTIALIVWVPAFVLGGWYGNVCRHSSDGPTCRTDLDCNDPEVHCYKPYGFTRGKCCVKLDYACPNGPGRYDDPKGFHRVLSGASPPFLGFSVAGIITVALHGKDQQRFLESAALTDAYLVKVEELTRQRKQYVQLEFTEYNFVIELKW